MIRNAHISVKVYSCSLNREYWKLCEISYKINIGSNVYYIDAKLSID